MKSTAFTAALVALALPLTACSQQDSSSTHSSAHNRAFTTTSSTGVTSGQPFLESRMAADLGDGDRAFWANQVEMDLEQVQRSRTPAQREAALDDLENSASWLNNSRQGGES